MKLKQLAIAVLLITAACGEEKKNEMEESGTKEKTTAPVADKIEHVHSMHGHDRVDNYHWMRLTDDQKESENPDEQTKKVVSYIEAENAYTKAILKPTEKLQEKLFKEMVGRIKETDENVPHLDNGYYYYDRFEEGKEYEIIARKVDKGRGEMGSEEILLDVNQLAEGHEYYDLGDCEVSPDNTILAYSYDDVSRRQYTIVFKNLKTNELYADKIENTGGDIVWAKDNKTIFYIKKDPTTLREFQVYRHELGTPTSSDVKVYQEDDETYSLDISKTMAGDYVLISSNSTMTSEQRFLEADNPTGDLKVFYPRERGILYDIHQHDDEFYIVTNWNATNYRVMKSPAKPTNKTNWVEVIPHCEETLIEDLEVFSSFYALQERTNGLTKIRVKSYNGSMDDYIEFGEETYAASIGENLEYNSKLLRYNYSSLKVPATVLDYNVESQTSEIKKRKEVLGDFDPENYETQRVWAPAPDGKKVPVSLIYRKGTKLDGSAPLLLYGYGSYGYTIQDKFSSPRLSLIDRGFIYAIAHIRGSEYMGRQWYEDGKKLTKMNTFTDFIAAGEFLIKEKYTSGDRLFAMGGSAGGLLMGAVINIRPEIWRGVIAAVPFVDVVSTMLDESIPLTTGEFDEWGNPKDQEYYHYMLSYSPYDQIEAKDYPNMLVTTGYWDSQVQYWEPAKWVAKLRELKTDDNLLLFDCNMTTGHGGASGRYEAYKETAMEYAFILHLMNIHE